MQSTLHNSRPGIVAHLLIACIWIYRGTLSPVIGQSCRFYPTCSHYAEDSIRSMGAWSGSMLAIRRILKCHPFHAGGYDPAPEKKAHE